MRTRLHAQVLLLLLGLGHGGQVDEATLEAVRGAYTWIISYCASRLCLFAWIAFSYISFAWFQLFSAW